MIRVTVWEAVTDVRITNSLAKNLDLYLKLHLRFVCIFHYDLKPMSMLEIRYNLTPLAYSFHEVDPPILEVEI
jgi:hypothetical protein